MAAHVLSTSHFSSALQGKRLSMILRVVVKFGLTSIFVQAVIIIIFFLFFNSKYFIKAYISNNEFMVLNNNGYFKNNLLQMETCFQRYIWNLGRLYTILYKLHKLQIHKLGEI